MDLALFPVSEIIDGLCLDAVAKDVIFYHWTSLWLKQFACQSGTTQKQTKLGI